MTELIFPYIMLIFEYTPITRENMIINVSVNAVLKACIKRD